MLNTVPKKRMRVAAALTDPRASFVSVVDHAANQTPFNVVRMAGVLPASTGEVGQTATPLIKGLEVETMAGKDTVDVHKITFSKDVFADEAAVKTFLEDAGFDGNITEDGDTFVVKGADLTDDAELITIDGEKGVSYGVTKAPVATDDAADDAADETATKDAASADEAPAEGSVDEAAAPDSEAVVKSFLSGDMTQAEVVQKYDSWWASYSEGKDIATVMADGVDGLPIGIYELNDAFYTALRNNLITGDYASARAVVTEFGELVIRLCQALEDAVVAPTEDVTKAILGGPDAATDPADGTEAGEETDTATEEVTDGSEESTQKSAAASDDAPADTGDDAPVSGDLATQIGNAISASMTDVVKTLTASIDAMGKQTSDTLGKMQVDLTKATERVDSLERRSQTRKGADADDVGSSAPDAPATTTKAAVDPLKANTLGLRRW